MSKRRKEHKHNAEIKRLFASIKKDCEQYEITREAMRNEIERLYAEAFEIIAKMRGQ